MIDRFLGDASVLQNGQDKTPNAFAKQQSIIKYASELEAPLETDTQKITRECD